MEDKALTDKIERHLANTKDTQPGPDMIAYKLLRAIKDPALGWSILNDIASMVPTEARQEYKVPKYLRTMQMVMIPKPNKDITRVKAWRPIVLSNCVAKLSEKAIAERVQKIKMAFHRLQFGSLKGRLVTDSMMSTKAVIQRNKYGKYTQASIIGKDVVSAFNNSNHNEIVSVVGKYREYLVPYITRFMEKKIFAVSWEGEKGGIGRMNQGLPQGSPLSPVLWCISIAVVLKRADQRCLRLIPRRPILGHMTNITAKQRAQNLGPPSIQVHMYSYVDDVNSVIITKNTTAKEHNRVRKKVDTILKEEARKSSMRWDREKQSLLWISKQNAIPMRQLGVK